MKPTELEVNDMNNAPKDGSTIIGIYGDNTCLIFWSERPVCMLGPVNGGFPEGWAVAPEEEGVDTNLPMDEPDYWRNV